MDADMDDAPLDFEREDLLLSSLPTPKRRRVKLIGLDDLLNDHYNEQNKIREKESKRAKIVPKIADSDDEIDVREKNVDMLSQFVDECQKEVEEAGAEDDGGSWGVQAFGDQKPHTTLDFPQLGSCSLFQSVMNNELNSILELTPEKGQSFLEELLINGWLLDLSITSAHVEESIASWTFYLMLYSSKEEVRASACKFWCTILSYKDEVGLGSIKIEWFPRYSDIKEALEVYGYLLYSSKDFVPHPVTGHNDSDSEGPPQNIRPWIKFVAVCCQERNPVSIFSDNSEVEELLAVIITFLLDRKLQGLSMLVNECMLSLISFFADNEWFCNCERVARSLASRAQRNVNCLRLVDCISGVDARSKQLRREVAFQCLQKFLSIKANGDGEGEILNCLMSTNVKEDGFDFNKTYTNLVLSEYWLFSNPLLEENPVIRDMWVAYLRMCSCQILSTDMRPCASKVRNKASFILQSTARRKDNE
ncbi:hypothetical protein ACHQM5_020538 [Ranunculus cassubicifolius]